MKRFFLLTLLCALLLTACGSKYDRISQELGVDVDSGQVLYEDDTHGGFHNDGLLRLKIKLPEGTILPQEWESLPLSDEAAQASQLTEELTDFFPQLTEGRWLLIDRNQGQPGALIDRGYDNFTLALFDPASQTLWYCALDT